MATKSKIHFKPGQRVSLGVKDSILPIPNLTDSQLKSYDWFLKEGLKTLFDEINPINDHLEKLWTLRFKQLRLGEENRSEEESRKKDLAYDASLYVKAELTNKITGEIKEQELFVADLPLMTPRGTFVINGTERVIIHQILRAEGVLYVESKSVAEDRVLYAAKLIPYRGPWYEFDLNKNGVMSVKLLNKRPKILITTLLRAYGYSTDEEIRKLFADIDTDEEIRFIDATLEKDTTKNTEEAVIDIYRKLRPEDSVTLETAEAYIKDFFFNPERFDLGEIGRYQLNSRLEHKKDMAKDNYKFELQDLIDIVRKQIQINNGVLPPDDIDHLANRRIRTVGELLMRKVRMGMRRMEKNIKDRMSLFGQEETDLTPSMLVSTKPVSASMHEFFATSQLSRYLEQKNILQEIKTKTRVTVAGPGGMEAKRAPFSVRDVHHSHYSRFCPITTPEGQNIGVINTLSMYAKINDYGFIEAPFRRVYKTAKNAIKSLVNKIVSEDVVDPKGNKVLVKAGEFLDEAAAKKIAAVSAIKEVAVRPYITDEIDYIQPADDDKHVVTISTIGQDDFGNLTDDIVPMRKVGHFVNSSVFDVTHIDVDPSQIASFGLALIPFAAHNDGSRCLMGSNMQGQGVPLVKAESPIVGTGFEAKVAKASGYAVYAPEDGVVEYVDGDKLVFKGKGSKRYEYKIFKFRGSNDNTSWSQSPRVQPGQKMKKDDLMIDGPAMDNGELALGANLTVAFMSFQGNTYEDSLMISERLVKEDVLTSIHIKEYVHEVRETKLGPEILTRDIPNVSEKALRNLDEDGIVTPGALVKSGDVLVGCIAPKGEVDLSPEERLLRSIFGEYAHEVRDNSLRVPHGQEGIVVGVQILDKAAGDKLSAGTLKQIKVWMARMAKISVGDKLAGRYGDKGVIAKVMAEEDMPYLEDGTPVDIIMTPFIIKRMNIGQVLEADLGAKAAALGIKVAVPNFQDVDYTPIEEAFKEQNIEFKSKVTVYDGMTGIPYEEKITVGKRYIMKLDHLAFNKIHARSTGPYTLVTQQPLGGKSQMGGQRFGEMEVWALESYGASHILREMLTIKSDDVAGRSNAYKAIIQGEKIETPSIPESFKVMVSELQALGLKVSLFKQNLFKGKVEEIDSDQVVADVPDIETVQEEDVAKIRGELDENGKEIEGSEPEESVMETE
jgi:DNA-directed RNA polymerase subunit beta